MGVQAGEREAVHATGLGKVLISEMEEAEIRALFAGQSEFHRYTENTIANVDELIEEVRRVRVAGYAMDNQEFGVGLICVAKPVRDYTGKIVAAISVSAPSNRMDEERRATTSAPEDKYFTVSYEGVESSLGGEIVTIHPGYTN